MSGEKGTSPASSVLVPRLAGPANLAERVSTCRTRLPLHLGEEPQPLHPAPLHHGDFAPPATASFPLRTVG
ncbi:hypothetical protein LIER_21300 [Lithospermum erythrorhizon]|uniref:Uncharacterized protein n=1 Tax=Lithospermum erythrorhizon TaxID=34254 RepID=A0AAV3QSX1_LITER